MKFSLIIEKDAENMKDPFGHPYSRWVNFERIRKIAGDYEFELSDFSRVIGYLADKSNDYRNSTWRGQIETDSYIIAQRDDFKESPDVYWDRAIENRARICLNHLKYLHCNNRDPLNGIFPFTQFEGTYDGIPHLDVHPAITRICHEDILLVLEKLPKTNLK